MYYFLGIIIVLLCLFSIFHFWKKRKILCKLACMSACRKYDLLNSLVEPFGYLYMPEWDVFSSRIDAWQKEFGFGKIYDQVAPYFNMVYEKLPIYFDYNGKTWLIEVWKGQYGINSGCEVGVYHADNLIDSEDRARTIFHAASGYEMPVLSTELWRKGHCVAALRKRHWWLTTFEVGVFSQPSQLSLDVTIQFPNLDMKNAFCKALREQGIDYLDVVPHDTAVFFHFRGHTPKAPFKGLTQRMNRMNCRLFRFVTRRCCTSCDRILYLYFYLPFVCRRLLRRHFRRKRR